MPEENPEGKIDRLRRAMYSRKVAGALGKENRHALSNDDAGIPHNWNAPRDDASAPGVAVAPKSLRYTRTALLVVFGITLVFFLASAGVFVWYLLGGFGTDVRSNNIDIEINGPLAIVGGEPSELEIVITNRNKAPLEFADLVISYPLGTRSVTDLATDLPQQRISLGTIEPGGKRAGTVSAVLVGEGGSEAVIEVAVEYQVAGGTAIFSAEEDYAFTFAASPVSIAVEGKHEVIPGQPITLVANVSANTNTTLRDVLLQLEVPFGFTVNSATPTPGEALLWNLGDLRPGDMRTVTVHGVMKGQSGDERVFRFRAGTKQGSGTAITVPLAEVVQKVVITQPFIGLSVGVNRQYGSGAAVVRAGEKVTIDVDWRNELNTAITNAVLVANLSGIGIDGTKIQTSDGFYRSADNTVVWDASTSGGKLASLAPGASGSVSFTFTVPTEVQLDAYRNPSLNIAIRAAADRTDRPDVPQGLESSAVRTLKVETIPAVLAHGFYSQNPFGARGPMPPKANQETTYAILLSAGNSTNPVNNAKVVAQLPPYIRWTGVYRPDTEQLSFDQKSGTVTWNIGSLSAGAGRGNTPVRQVAFEIAFTPSAGQVGQTPNLLSDIVFTGTDSFTNTSLRRNIQSVTTEITSDPGYVDSHAEVVQ